MVVCPGDDFVTLIRTGSPDTACACAGLSMLKLADPGLRFPSALMSDLSLTRYRGYAALPRLLEAKLRREQPEHYEHGVHLIVAQGGDGGLIVGDSHHYDHLPAPFAPAEAEACILDEPGRLAPPPYGTLEEPMRSPRTATIRRYALG